ncbi:MAG: CDGSH iron-sulfur domain-containing protein [Gemmatimonadales bacterium]
MADITVSKNGPYLIKGAIRLLNADGSPIEVEKNTFALCRCGHSASKPFCDGSHRAADFSPDS